MGLVAGRGVKLRKRDSASWVIPVEIRPTYLGAGEVGARQRREVEVRIREIRLAKIRIGQVGDNETAIGEVRLAQVRAGQVAEANAAQIVGRVAGRGVQLRERDSGSNEIRAPHIGASKVGACQRGKDEVRIRKVLASE